MDSLSAIGIVATFAFVGCAGADSRGTGPSEAGAPAMVGTSGQASGDAGTDGGAGGTPSNSDTDANAGGTVPSTSGDASGAPGSGETGGPANVDASAKGGEDGGLDAPATGDAKASGPGCSAGLLFCDDFESYTTGAPPNGKWTAQVRGSAQAVVDTAMPYSGTRSVHFTGTVNQSSANIIAQGAPVFPLQGNTIFIRMMMYIQSFPATAGTHSRFMRIGTNTNGLNGTAYALDTYNGTGIEHVNSGMFRDTSLHLTDATVKGKWVCWEWELDNTAGPPVGNTGTVMAYLWRDGAAVTLATTRDSLPWNPIPWQLLEVGLEAYQADTQSGDFWIDDVAMNNTKIGCPTK